MYITHKGKVIDKGILHRATYTITRAYQKHFGILFKRMAYEVMFMQKEGWLRIIGQ